MQGRNFGKAKEYFEAAMAAAAWCEENAPLREAAVNARNAAAAAKKKADALDGAHLALRNCKRAGEKAVAGKTAFDGADFRTATSAWNEAKTAYEQAESDARNAKVEQGLEAARGAKKRAAWEAVVEAAEGVLALEAGNAEAVRLKAEAQKHIDDARKAAEAEQRKKEQEEAERRRESERKAEEARKAAEAKRAAEEAAKGPKAGDVKSIDLGNGVMLEMVHCPGVARDFWMGKYEVTQEQWQKVMGKNPSHFAGKPKNPVENVSWDDCWDFVQKLNAMPAARASGLTFRLPTEEEWETACRAGAPKSADYCKLADGTQITAEMLGKVARFGKGRNDGPVAVGSFRPNAWGLYDMHGNVWEWTETAVGGNRVLRGGSFLGGTGSCSAGGRGRHYPGYAHRYLGFRLAASGR